MGFLHQMLKEDLQATRVKSFVSRVSFRDPTSAAWSHARAEGAANNDNANNSPLFHIFELWT